MAPPSVPSAMPDSLVAGATWEWTDHLADSAGVDFPPGGGATATLYLSGQHSLEVAASDNGDGTWLFLATDEKTTAVVGGNYRWHILGGLSGKVYSLGSGAIQIASAPTVTAASDQRSFAAKMLESVENELLARVPGTGAATESFSIGIRQFQNVPLEQLEKLRVKYAIEVAMEGNGGKLPDVEVHFVRA